MKRIARVVLWEVVVCTLLVATPAGADPIYTNIGLLPEPYSRVAFGLGGPTNLQQADWFIATVSGPVGSLEVPIGVFYGSSFATFSLMTDAGTWPGTVIDTFTFSSLPTWQLPLAGRNLLGANSTLGAMVLAGTRYWLLGVTDGPSTLLGWAQSNTGDASRGEHYIRMLNAQGRWIEGFEGVGDRAAFRLNTNRLDQSSPVPEPATILLLGSGAALIGVQRLRRRSRSKQG